MIKVNIKGGKGSGFFGHAGRPGREGGSLKSGYGPPPIGKDPGTHIDGDKDGSQDYEAWLNEHPNTSDADKVKMRAWFKKRAGEIEGRIETKRDRNIKKGKIKIVKPKKSKAPKAPKPKKEPKSKTTSPEVQEKIAKGVGLGKEALSDLRSVVDALRAGDSDKLDIDKARALINAGFLERSADGKISVPSATLSLLKAIEKGDGIAARHAKSRLDKARESKIKVRKRRESKEGTKALRVYVTTKRGEK